ncbi:MAG TPA: tRNA glutamyl-Q(34) synthetase GluQRS [Xanthomonadaceae bacterium]|nr:tRNA glutamyl-Q(34) synthetase GluQRS [Xanthomonadaceae bacterium]
MNPIPPEPYRGRFAPSPTGALHFGSLLAALGSWIRARQADGGWLVRIEDLDPPRTVAGASLAQIDTLRRFGMESDHKPLWQSERGDHYQTVLDSLIAGGHAYPCACSRNDLAPFDGRHPPHCVASQPERPPAWRLRMTETTVRFVDALQGPQSFALQTGDDVVLKRTDGHFAYQLAVVVDDAAQGITEVVRGADLLAETPRQIHLQQILDYPTPAYLHLPLLLDAEGRKLSKSEAAMPVDAADPLPALRAAIRLLGIEPDGGSVDDLLRHAVRDTDWRRLAGIRAIPAPPI